MEVLPTYGPERSESAWQQYVSAIPGCSTARSTNTTIACVRNANTTSILKAFTTAGLNFNNFVSFQPVIDGPTGMVTDRNSQIKADHLNMPLIIGTNLDEGTLFTPQNTDSDAIISGFLQDQTAPNLPTVTSANKTRVINQIIALYPDIPSLGSPFNTGNDTFGLSSEYKQFSAIRKDDYSQRALTSRM